MTAKKPEAEARPVTRELAAKSMRRIVSQFPIGENTKDYFETIYEQVRLAGLTEDLFEGACIRLAGTMLPYKPPMASEYLAAAARIKATGARRRDDCPKCNGRGWIYVADLRAGLEQRVVDPKDARAGEKLAVADCQECRHV